MTTNPAADHPIRPVFVLTLNDAFMLIPERGRLRPEIWDAWRAAHHG
jgi:hypothetical protein